MPKSLILGYGEESGAIKRETIAYPAKEIVLLYQLDTKCPTVVWAHSFAMHRVGFQILEGDPFPIGVLAILKICRETRFLRAYYPRSHSF